MFATRIKTKIQFDDAQKYKKTNNSENHYSLIFDVKGNSTIQRVIESSQHKCKQNGKTQF